MTISKLIKVLNAKARKLGPDAKVRIERVYDYGDNDCGFTVGLAIGLPIAKMKDEQTLKEFKRLVLEQLKKIGWKGDSIDEVKIRSDAGYDG